jgi:hypothetical protein
LRKPDAVFLLSGYFLDPDMSAVPLLIGDVDMMIRVTAATYLCGTVWGTHVTIEERSKWYLIGNVVSLLFGRAIKKCTTQEKHECNTPCVDREQSTVLVCWYARHMETDPRPDGLCFAVRNRDGSREMEPSGVQKKRACPKAHAASESSHLDPPVRWSGGKPT